MTSSFRRNVITALACAGLAAGFVNFAAGPAAADTVWQYPPISLTSPQCPANIVEGDSGVCVTALQVLLTDWGYGEVVGAADGSFGPKTLAAVQAFQASAAISTDGQVGTQTKGWLLSQSNFSVGHIQLQNLYSGKCLDADTGTAGRNGQTVQAWACGGNQATNQGWSLRPVPKIPGAYMLVNYQDGLCLDADTNTQRNGQIIQGWTCNGWHNQEWYEETGYNGARQLVNVGDGLALDADSNTASLNSQRVQGWQVLNDPEQAWYVDLEVW